MRKLFNFLRFPFDSPLYIIFIKHPRYNKAGSNVAIKIDICNLHTVLLFPLLHSALQYQCTLSFF